MESEPGASTPVDLMQRQRESAAQQQAQASAAMARGRLVAQGRESATEYGRALFAAHGAGVAAQLDQLLTDWICNLDLAGPHYCALPLLLWFRDSGIRPLAAIALGKTLDSLSRRVRHRALASSIGRAVEDEVKAARLQAIDPAMVRVVRRAEGAKAITDPASLRALGVSHASWSSSDRFEVGALLLGLVAETGLVRIVEQQHKGRRIAMVEPTDAALAWINGVPAARARAKRLPMLLEPIDWTGLTGGGHHDGEGLLIHCRDGLDREWAAGQDWSTAIKVCNRLQRQELVIDPWMVDVQRQAWESAWPTGLFPVTREPEQPPPPPTGDSGWGQWHRERRRVGYRERAERPARVRIEETLQQSSAISGAPIWLSYSCDHRGRVYTSNRAVTNQGPDWEKASLSFRQAQPIGDDGVDWLLKAAAGHWGMGRRSWRDRLAWGRGNTWRLCAIAEQPLERLDLWRGASDPWQFLQVARAYWRWGQDPSAGIGCPIRLDQSNSGLGIAAALLRHPQIARWTNMTGSSPRDIYLFAAALVRRQLRDELQLGSPNQQRMAAFWLERGVDRGLLKGPVMTWVYGARGYGLVERLMDLLLADTQLGRGSDYEDLIIRPARYLGRVLARVLTPLLAPATDLQGWLQACARACHKAGYPVEYITPMAFPVRLARTLGPGRPARTHLSGNRGWREPDADRRETELAGRATGRSIAANVVHSFDASLLHAVVCRGEATGLQLLVNHDCFAAMPAQASMMQRLLLDETRALFAEDWLGVLATEIRFHAPGVEVPDPPARGQLSPADIGSNSYLFS